MGAVQTKLDARPDGPDAGLGVVRLYLNNEERGPAEQRDQEAAVPALLLRAHQYHSWNSDKELSSQLASLCTKLGIAPTKLRQASEINVINTQTHLQ
jgi:hypothetical protein